MISKKLYKLLLLLSWMALIFYLSGQAAHESSQQSAVVLHALQAHDVNVTMHATRKAAHFLYYLVLGVLFCNVLRDYRKTLRGVALWSIAGSALYAMTDEFHQLFMSGRSSELRDVALDTLGASIGVGLYVLVCIIARKKRRFTVH